MKIKKKAKNKASKIQEAIDALLETLPEASLYLLLDDGETYSCLDGCKLIAVDNKEEISSTESDDDAKQSAIQQGKVLLKFSTTPDP
jgi:hypothetical protein